jgi:hypothetical protein
VEPNAKKGALTLFAIGFGFSVLGFVDNGLFGTGRPLLAQGCSLAMIFGDSAVMMASVMLARAKGYAWQVGLVGVLSFVGFGIVWFALKDRTLPTTVRADRAR